MVAVANLTVTSNVAVLASLLYAIAYILLMYIPVHILYRKKIFIKV